jgi:hypothetical protein
MGQFVGQTGRCEIRELRLAVPGRAQLPYSTTTGQVTLVSFRMSIC